jgi:hypothetical protein
MEGIALFTRVAAAAESVRVSRQSAVSVCVYVRVNIFSAYFVLRIVQLPFSLSHVHITDVKKFFIHDGIEFDLSLTLVYLYWVLRNQWAAVALVESTQRLS